jgi:hypothetical protein
MMKMMQLGVDAPRCPGWDWYAFGCPARWHRATMQNPLPQSWARPTRG